MQTIVKQSTLAVTLSVPRHHSYIQYVKPYGIVGCHYSVCADGATSLRGVVSRIDIVF